MKGSFLNQWKWWQIDLTGAVACIVITLLMLAFGIGPLYFHMQQSRGLVKQVNAQQVQSARANTALAELRRQLEHINAEVALSPVRLESSRAINQRLARFTELARQCSLKIDEIKPGPTTVGTWYETVPIHVAGSGGFSSCVEFLHRLHQLFPDTRVTTFDLAGKPQQPNAPAGVVFELAWFAAPGSPTPGPGAGSPVTK